MCHAEYRVGITVWGGPRMKWSLVFGLHAEGARKVVDALQKEAHSGRTCKPTHSRGAKNPPVHTDFVRKGVLRVSDPYLQRFA